MNSFINGMGMNGYTRGLAGLEWNPGVKPGILSAAWLRNASPGEVISRDDLEVSTLKDEASNPGKIFVQVKNGDDRYTGRWVDPNDPYDLAIINRDYDTALGLAEARLERDSNDPDALFDKAYALSYLNKPEEAIASYDRVIEREPENDTVMNNKAVELDKLGRHEEALRLFKKAHEINPHSLIIKSNLAYSLRDAGNHDEYTRLMREILYATPATLEDRLFLENLRAETGMSAAPAAPASAAPAAAAPAAPGIGGLF